MIDPPVYRRLQPSLYRLEGVRCPRCGVASIGVRKACGACGNRSLESVRFGGRGRIVAWTTVLKPPADHARLGAYPIALIELEEGPRVLAKLADAKSRPPEKGKAVEVVLRRLYEPGPEELICYGYKFRADWDDQDGGKA